MGKKYLYLSFALHFVLLLLLLLEVPFWFSSKKDMPEENVMMVDLSQLKIAEMTNAPKKRAKPKKELKEEKTQVKKEVKKAPLKSKAPTIPEQKKQEKAEDASLIKELPKKDKKEPKNSKQAKQDKQSSTAMKNLLASVEKMKKQITPIEEEPLITKDDKHKGIEGGKAGSYIEDLSISEKDALALKLRSCWNLDAGVKGIENMIVEVKTSLRADGSVANVKIANSLRYASDTAFRSVAESAKRAVLICADLGNESPFVMLAKRHPEKYELWREMTLFFNPLAGTVN